MDTAFPWSFLSGEGIFIEVSKLSGFSVFEVNPFTLKTKWV